MATEPPIDKLAGKLLRTSRNPAVRSIAAAALSDIRLHAHTHRIVASIASDLMQNSPSRNVRRVAASVLSDRQRHN
jgi:hypothetical protein